MRALLTCALLTLFTSTAPAQIRAGGSLTPFSAPQTVPPGFATFGITPPLNPSFPAHTHPFGHMSGNSLVVFSDGYPSTVPQPLSVIVVQPSASAPPAQEQTSVAKPLLLELQGDHWVEVATRDRRKLEPSRAREKFRDSQNSPAATVLVFRDGHTELTRSYTIIAGVLFADSDFFSTGAWSRRIPLAALDIAATARANQQRGTVFSLPLAANEVVVNP